MRSDRLPTEWLRALLQHRENMTPAKPGAIGVLVATPIAIVLVGIVAIRLFS